MKRPPLENIIVDPQSVTGHFRGCEGAMVILVEVAKYALVLEHDIKNKNTNFQEIIDVITNVKARREESKLSDKDVENLEDDMYGSGRDAV